MGDYLVTYFGDSISMPNHYFKVDYKLMGDDGKVKDEFVLKPNSQANRKMGLVSSPDTKHYFLHDLYTHVTMAPIRYEEDDPTGGANAHSDANDDQNYDAPVAHEVAVGDTIIAFRDGTFYPKLL